MNLIFSNSKGELKEKLLLLKIMIVVLRKILILSLVMTHKMQWLTLRAHQVMLKRCKPLNAATGSVPERKIMKMESFSESLRLISKR